MREGRCRAAELKTCLSINRWTGRQRDLITPKKSEEEREKWRREGRESVDQLLY